MHCISCEEKIDKKLKSLLGIKKVKVRYKDKEVLIEYNSKKINGGENLKAIEDEEYMKIPISEITTHLQKYLYDVNKAHINFFVVKDSQGKIKTAFDACDVCGGYKGYRQEGNDVVCNNCWRVFDIDYIGTKNKVGGCWPSYLKNKIENDFLLISKEELSKGSFRFV